MATYKMAAETARGKGKHFGMKWIRPESRLGIYLRDGMACMWCGSGLEDGAQLTLDHIVPHAKGGTNSPANLATCCHRCNSSRADRDAEEFAVAVAAYVNHGATAEAILSAIREHAAKPIKEYRDEAKALLARRPSWTEALKGAGKE